MPPGQITIDGPLTGQAAVCEPILRALPDWFGIESAIVEYLEHLDAMPTFLAHAGGELVGFLAIKHHFDHAAEMYVLGVLADHHRAGIGRALVAAAESWLRERGIEYLQVKTLSSSRGCEHYERTRRFYLAVGFRPLEEFPTLWDPANPCLQMVKRLEPPTAT